MFESQSTEAGYNLDIDIFDGNTQPDLDSQPNLSLEMGKNTSYVIVGGIPLGLKKLTQNEFYGDVVVPDNIQASHFHQMLRDGLSSVTSIEGAKDHQVAETIIGSLLISRFKSQNEAPWTKLSESVKQKLLAKSSWTYPEFVKWCERRGSKEPSSTEAVHLNNTEPSVIATFKLGNEGTSFVIEEGDIADNIDPLTPAPAALLSILPQLLNSNKSLRDENTKIRQENANLRQENKDLREQVKAAKENADEARKELFDANTTLASQRNNVNEAGKSLEPIVDMISKINTKISELATNANKFPLKETRPKSIAELFDALPESIHIFCSAHIQNLLVSRDVTGPILEGLKEVGKIIFLEVIFSKPHLC